MNNRKVAALEKISKELENYIWALRNNCYCACDLPKSEDEEEPEDDPQHHDDCPDALVSFMVGLMKIARDSLQDGSGNG